MALGAEDVSRKDHPGEGMAEMIEFYLRKLPEGELEIKQQQVQQFPLGYEKEEKAQHESDIAALKKVAEAVAVSQVMISHDTNKTIPDATCEKALEDFRKYLVPKGVIKTGKHFNANLLVEAFKLYEEKYEAFGCTWNSPRNMLFWQKIIGYIQRYLPACYAQAFSQGLHFVVNRNEKLGHSFKDRFDNVFFFPLDARPEFRLGYDYAAGSRFKWGGRACSRAVRAFKTFVEQKLHHYDFLCNDLESVGKHTCQSIGMRNTS